MAPLIHQNNPLDAFTDVATTTPTPRALIAVGAVLPVLAYPFLPSPSNGSGQYNDALEILLIWPSMLHPVLFHFLNAMLRGLGEEYFHFQPWVVPLTVCSLMVGMAGFAARSEYRLEPRREDFADAANITFAIILWELAWLTSRGISVEAGLSLQVVRTLAWVTGVIVLGVIFDQHFVEPATTVLYRFTKRRVSWWFWLPENGAKKKFQPLWSEILAVFVFVSAPILLFEAARVIPSRPRLVL